MCGETLQPLGRQEDKGTSLFSEGGAWHCLVTGKSHVLKSFFMDHKKIM